MNLNNLENSNKNKIRIFLILILLKIYQISNKLKNKILNNFSFKMIKWIFLFRNFRICNF